MREMCKLQWELELVSGWENMTEHISDVLMNRWWLVIKVMMHSLTEYEKNMKRIKEDDALGNEYILYKREKRITDVES